MRAAIWPKPGGNVGSSSFAIWTAAASGAELTFEAWETAVAFQQNTGI
jgi:hypothetical protein